MFLYYVNSVIPVKTGIQEILFKGIWIPAFAGMTRNTNGKEIKIFFV
jgi:hypothetical protein